MSEQIIDAMEKLIAYAKAGDIAGSNLASKASKIPTTQRSLIFSAVLQNLTSQR